MPLEVLCTATVTHGGEEGRQAPLAWICQAEQCPLSRPIRASYYSGPERRALTWLGDRGWLCARCELSDWPVTPKTRGPVCCFTPWQVSDYDVALAVDPPSGPKFVQNATGPLRLALSSGLQLSNPGTRKDLHGPASKERTHSSFPVYLAPLNNFIVMNGPDSDSCKFRYGQKVHVPKK
jgi:hypothetical protein